MTIHCIVGDESLTQELLAVLSMMVGTNVTSGQLLSIADRMLLETDLDKVAQYSTWHMHQTVKFIFQDVANQDGFISFEEFQGSLIKLDVGKKMSLRYLK